METEMRIPTFDLINSISSTMDLVTSAVANHQHQVAYIAHRVATELNMPPAQKNSLLLAGALHDVGAFSEKEKMDLLQFDLEDPYHHAEAGYLLLKNFDPLSDVSLLVRFHHVPWDQGRGLEFKGEEVPAGSHILHLADRTAILINKQEDVLSQVQSIRSKIEEFSGKRFMPQLVDRFKSLVDKESFWLDAASPSLSSLPRMRTTSETIELDEKGLLGLADLFHQVIDFRSEFTATHSSGVAAVAEALAGLCMFSERECRMMRVAGYLHDLGKLGIPAEILQKPAKLSEDEWTTMRSHTYHTYRTLEPIATLHTVNVWASFHHERLDGEGYPFRLKGDDLTLGSRIMAAADVFTALTEDRPYRKGMSNQEALKVLEGMADNSRLDARIVSLLKEHFDVINSIRTAAQQASAQEYDHFLSQLEPH